MYLKCTSILLGTSSEIVQLACASGDNLLQYILPTCPITTSATAVTGLYVLTSKAGRNVLERDAKQHTQTSNNSSWKRKHAQIKTA